MIAHSYRFPKVTVGAAAVLAGLMVASCAPDTPNVSYTFHNDEEFLQANQDAASFCKLHGAIPRRAHITDNPADPDDKKGRVGSMSIAFNCVQVAYKEYKEKGEPEEKCDYFCMKKKHQNQRNYDYNYQHQLSTPRIGVNPMPKESPMPKMGP
jgi:hypothetical protein